MTSERGKAPTEKHSEALEAALADPAEHAPRLIHTRDVHFAMHGTSAIERFNAYLAVIVTRSVGTMWAAYLFVLISLISFPQALDAFLKGDRITGITWLSQSFLQLVLLPIILVGQNVISAVQDARAESDHETLTALHTINVRQLRILEQEQKILRLLDERTGP